MRRRTGGQVNPHYLLAVRLVHPSPAEQGVGAIGERLGRHDECVAE
jgi:hypothetical protein